MVYISKEGPATQLSGSAVHLYSWHPCWLSAKTRVETQPNFALYIHFIRNDASAYLYPYSLHILLQTAYGAEYA